MNRDEFLNLSLEQQVNYINDNMRAGKSLTTICNEVGVSKSISAKFKKQGYELINGQYELQQLEGQLNIFEQQEKPQEEQKTEIDTIAPIEEESLLKASMGKIAPPEPKAKKSITNISMDSDLKKQLQVYCIMNDITFSELLERLGKEFIDNNK